MNLLHNFPWLISLPSLMLIALVGMFTNFLKKKITGETLTDIANYFRDHVRETILAFIATEVGTLFLISTLGTGQPIDMAAVFTLGYTFDSMFNKWEKAQQ